MRAIKYTTSENLIMKKDFIMPTDIKMGGVKIIESEDNPLDTKFQGFGVAVTGASCFELNSMDKDSRRKFLEDIYGENGLGLSVGRLTIGSSDYSAELYSYDDVENDTELIHFSVKRDEEYIIPMIKEILSIRPDIMLYASPWSPPGWMKTGGSMCGGYMREKFTDCYAHYILKYIDEYEKRGIHISAVTPQNEPETNQGGKMPACMWHPDIEAEFITRLKEELDRAEKNTEIWIHDHCFSSADRVLWQLENYPELLKNCGGAAFHYYNGNIEMTQPILKKYPGLKLHFTEGGPRLYDNYQNDFCKWGAMMSKTLNNGYSSFTGWNLLLDETGGPNIGPFFCGGLATLDSKTQTLSYSGQYRAFSHFSRFIKRGAEVYPSKITNDGALMWGYPKMTEPGVECCTVKNPDGSFILEIVNPKKEKAQLQFKRGGKWWYTEALPGSVVTVIFEQ